MLTLMLWCLLGITTSRVCMSKPVTGQGHSILSISDVNTSVGSDFRGRRAARSNPALIHGDPLKLSRSPKRPYWPRSEPPTNGTGNLNVTQASLNGSSPSHDGGDEEDDSDDGDDSDYEDDEDDKDEIEIPCGFTNLEIVIGRINPNSEKYLTRPQLRVLRDAGESLLGFNNDFKGYTYDKRGVILELEYPPGVRYGGFTKQQIGDCLIRLYDQELWSSLGSPAKTFSDLYIRIQNVDSGDLVYAGGVFYLEGRPDPPHSIFPIRDVVIDTTGRIIDIDITASYPPEARRLHERNEIMNGLLQLKSKILSGAVAHLDPLDPTISYVEVPGGTIAVSAQLLPGAGLDLPSQWKLLTDCIGNVWVKLELNLLQYAYESVWRCTRVDGGPPIGEGCFRYVRPVRPRKKIMAVKPTSGSGARNQSLDVFRAL